LIFPAVKSAEADRSLRCPAKPEAHVVAPAVRSDIETIRRTAALFEEVPAAAPNHPFRARGRTRRIGNTARRIGPVPVLAPLPHIPMHVV
jgi:hypothetical protein